MSQLADHDAFLDAYLAGTPAELPALTKRQPARVAPAAAIALQGCVLTPDGPVEGGWVVVENGQIAEVAQTAPAGATAVATDGVILPGLIDLHGHPEFNIFAPWEPPKQYVNRYAWRASDEYHALVRDPQNQLQTELASGTQLRYAEIRALAGGATAIQGASGKNRSADESLVRNVDLRIFGQHRARTMIDIPADTNDRGFDTLQPILAGIAAGEIDAFYLHLAEGQRDNKRSQDEFATLLTLNALTAATVVIHGTALTRDQFGQMHDAGAKLVWSPQSNLRLYGQTTPAADALAVGLPVALGADWLPSGSTSLLAEMKVARQSLANQGVDIPARQLVEMVTSVAAGIAGLADHLGSILPSRPADLLVLQRLDEDPYESVCRANPIDVELVTIGGDLAYGRTDWVTALAADPAASTLEPVIAWGRSMLLDTSYHANPNGAASRPLTTLRQQLTGVYPQVGPIWA